MLSGKLSVVSWFILTNSNYVYTRIGSIMCLAAVVYLYGKYRQNDRAKAVAVLGGALGVVASNQEQSACVLGGMLCGYIFWYFMT